MAIGKPSPVECELGGQEGKLVNCFYHQSLSAVGICKSCQKALCSGCAIDMGKGLACRGRCESDVTALTALVERSIRMSPTSAGILSSARGGMTLAGAFAAVAGLGFVFSSLLRGQGVASFS